MNDQRMVTVEFLRRLAGICASHRYRAAESALQGIIDGPGVEPVATLVEPPLESMKDNFWMTEEDAIRLSKLPYGTRLYLAAPSAPTPAVHLSDVWDGILERRKTTTPAPVPDPVPEIDLRVTAYEQLLQAAAESKWIPPEYYVNDWIADCCEFLRNGHDSVAPVQAVPDAEIERLAREHGTGGWQTLEDMIKFGRAVLAAAPQPPGQQYDEAMSRAIWVDFNKQPPKEIGE